MMIHFIFYRFAINPMPYCLNQFHFCSTYARVSYFLNMIWVVKKTGKAEKTWLSDYAISASNFDLAPKSFISHFFPFVSFIFGSFYLFSWNVSRMGEKIRFNWFMIVGGGDSKVPKIARLSSESLGRIFSVLSEAFHAHAMGECPRSWRKTEGKVFYGTNWL